MSVSSATDPRLLRALQAAAEQLETERQWRRSPIAIVGMACRLPGADSPQALWELLARGGDAVGPLSAERVAREGGRGPGGYLDRVDSFDPAPFGLSPRETASMDPQHRLLLEVVQDAFASAGWTRAALRERPAGVFVGVTSSDYAFLMARSGCIDHYFITGNTLNAAAGRVAYLFGLRGPALAVDTACSSSLAAVHLACQSLRSDDCDSAVAAGVNLVLAPESSQGLSQAGVLSADGRCHTFDASAAGMGRGEGCGVLLLKRLADAQRDGDRVLAVIRGSAMNQDGASGGLTVPNGPAQEAVIRRALAHAGLAPDAIDYLEAHGTGTALGDPIEMGALARVFGPGREASRPLQVGSIKANIAHGESSAGIAGLIKTVLCLQHEAIPPLAGLREPSPLIEWTDALQVPRALLPWPRAGRPRAAGISGFGLSGTNVHVVLTEPPLPPPQVAPGGAAAGADSQASALIAAAPPAPVVLPLSAGSAAGLARLAGAYARRLQADAVPLADIARTAARARDPWPQRLALVASEREPAVAALAAVAAGQEGGLTACPDAGSGLRGAWVVRGSAPAGREGTLAFMFSGQGTQGQAMGRELALVEPAFRDALAECTALLGRDPLAPLPGDPDGTAQAQPALLAYQAALVAWWRARGVVPAAVLGHSVGEFAAAWAAGVMTLGDAMALVAVRGRLMGALPRVGKMVGVLGTREQVRAAIAAVAAQAPAIGPLTLAAANAPGNQVISGAAAAVDAAVAALQAQGLRCTPLAVSHAFHSPLMEPVLAPLRELLGRVDLRAPQLPYFSGTLGRLAGAEVARPDYWLAHILQPVEFEAALRAAHGQGLRCFLEIGATRTLCGLGRATLGSDDAAWVASHPPDAGERQGLYRALGELHCAGADIDWSRAPGRGCDPASLPGYPFERQSFWFESPGPADPATALPGAAAFGGHELRWQAQAQLTSPGTGDGGGRWVITRDGGGLAQALAVALRAQGAAARVIEAGADTGDATDLVDCAAIEATDELPWAQGQSRGVLAVLSRLQANPPLRTWCITRQAQSVAGEPACLQQAALWGLGRVAALERPRAWGGLIDTDAATDPADLARELLHGVGGEVAWRGSRRHVARLQPGAWPSGSATSLAPSALRLSPVRSYVLTGAFGGLGLHSLQWLLACGARRLVLCARREPGPAAAAQVREAAQAAGARIECLQADLSEPDDARRLIAAAEALGPLGGIVHAAGQVDDALLADQDPARFERVMAGKVLGALHLDALTRSRALDLFVLFASLSGVLGSPGQANYAAANAMLDALASARRARGDVATSVAWGPWAGAGMASGLQAGLQRRGLSAWQPASALQALGPAVASGRAQVVLALMDPPAMRQAFPLARLASLDALAPRPEPAAAPPERPRDAGQALACLAQAMGAVLRAGPGWVPAAVLSLQAQGIDSMMAAEMRNRVQRDFGIDLPLPAFLGGATLQSLADEFMRQLALAALSAQPAHEGGEEVLL